MKFLTRFFFILALTALCLFVAGSAIINVTEPVNMEVGPHQLGSIDGQSTFYSKSDVLFTLKSRVYFEISRNDGSLPIQSINEPPAVGETESFYWIRDIRLDGEWLLSDGYAKIYSSAGNASVMVIPGFWARAVFSFLVTTLFTVIWLAGIEIIVLLTK